jgi:putative acetyltransferase
VRPRRHVRAARGQLEVRSRPRQREEHAVVALVSAELADLGQPDPVAVDRDDVLQPIGVPSNADLHARHDDPMTDAQQIRLATAADIDRLVALWERSVRETHDFLTESDIADLRPRVGEALEDEGLDLWVLVDPDETPIGFLGLAGDDISALFIDPAHLGQGGGRLLVAHAQRLRGGELTVDVNEQNPAARQFYEALGFTVVGRSPLDDEGRPFPLLHMRRQAGLA